MNRKSFKQGGKPTSRRHSIPTNPTSDKEFQRLPFYHINIPNTDIKKLTKLQSFILKRGLDIPNVDRVVKDSRPDSLNVTRSKLSRGGTKKGNSPNGNPTETSSSDEMLSIVKDLFEIAKQLPGFMNELLTDEDFHLDNITTYDIKGKRNKKKVETLATDSVPKAYVKKHVKSGSM